MMDKKKFEISPDMPEHFAYILPGHGVHHFTKKSLSDNDCKALIAAGCKYVKPVEKKKDNAEKEG